MISLLISRSIYDALLDSSEPCFNQTLLLLICVRHWLLVNTFLHDFPRPEIRRIKGGTLGKA